MQGRIIQKVCNLLFLPLFATSATMRFTLLLSFLKNFPMLKDLWSKHEECTIYNADINKGHNYWKRIKPKHADNMRVTDSYG